MLPPASLNLFGPVEAIAEAILKTVKDELGLVVTIGIGDNPLLVKLALDNEAKKCPPWIAKWPYEMVPEMVWKIQPLTAFWGISRGYDAKKLKRMGIYTIEGLAHAKPVRLQKISWFARNIQRMSLVKRRARSLLNGAG